MVCSISSGRQHVGQPIGAQEVELTWAGILLQKLRADAVSHVLGEDMPPGMARRSFYRQHTAVHLFLHPGVVPSELPEVLLFVKVRAAIAHVSDDRAQLFVTHDQRRQSRAMPVRSGANGRIGADAGVRTPGRIGHLLAQGRWRSCVRPAGARQRPRPRQSPAQLGSRYGTGDVSHEVPSHAVGHDRMAQLGVGEECILVPGMSPAPIGEA
jgi:hypothetical protein